MCSQVVLFQLSFSFKLVPCALGWRALSTARCTAEVSFSGNSLKPRDLMADAPAAEKQDVVNLIHDARDLVGDLEERLETTAGELTELTARIAAVESEFRDRRDARACSWIRQAAVELLEDVVCSVMAWDEPMYGVGRVSQLERYLDGFALEAAQSPRARLCTAMDDLELSRLDIDAIERITQLDAAMGLSNIWTAAADAGGVAAVLERTVAELLPEGAAKVVRTRQGVISVSASDGRTLVRAFQKRFCRS